LLLSPFGEGRSPYLKKLESTSPMIICAKYGSNWPIDYGEVENVIKVHKQTDGKTDEIRTTDDQKSSLELSAQVS
jgi:hypothetical protein